MDVEQRIFGMMAVLEEQQKVVQAALDGLAAEREAVSKERTFVLRALTSMNDVVSGAKKAVGDVVAASVTHSLAGASETAARALGEAAKPVISRLESVARAVESAEGNLNGAVASFGWRWAVVAGGAAAGGILALLLAAWISVGWQRHRLEALSEEVAQMKATAVDLAKRGGRAEIGACGDKKRPCVRVESGQRYGEDYYVLKGY